MKKKVDSAKKAPARGKSGVAKKTAPVRSTPKVVKPKSAKPAKAVAARAEREAKKRAPESKAGATERKGATGQARPRRAVETGASSFTEARVLRLQLQHNVTEVEVTWVEQVQNSNTPKKTWDSYYVPARALISASKDLRECLQAFQGLDWRDGGPNSFGDQSGLFADTLVQIVEAGKLLHDSIFKAEPDTAAEATAFKKWFDKNVAAAPVGSWRIEVEYYDYDAPLCPWGLASLPISGKEITTLDYSDPDSFMNFWGARFQTCVRRNDRDVGEVDLEVQGHTVSVACVLELDKDGLASMTRDSDPDGEAQVSGRARHDAGVKRQFYDDHVGWDEKSLAKLAKTHAVKNLFWYISLQPNGGSLGLPPETTATADGARRRKVVPADKVFGPINLHAKNKHDRLVLMFIDGDAIVRNDRGQDWLKRAMDLGRHGLIAVEADIDNPRLRNFGWRIMETVLKSKLPLLDAIADARRQWWPLGLLYGVYCNPVRARVSPPPIEDLNKVGKWLGTMGALMGQDT